MAVRKVGEVITEEAAQFVDLECVARDKYEAEAKDPEARMEVTIAGLLNQKVKIGDVLTGLRRVDADRVQAKYNERRNQTNPLKMVITGLSKDQDGAANANDKKFKEAVKRAALENSEKAIKTAEDKLGGLQKLAQAVEGNPEEIEGAVKKAEPALGKAKRKQEEATQILKNASEKASKAETEEAKEAADKDVGKAHDKLSAASNNVEKADANLTEAKTIAAVAEKGNIGILVAKAEGALEAAKEATAQAGA